ncbi:endo-1,4-beta-xylanase [Marinimicrobium agarilyticum]|uniref:endo-1,4-beta-xylanase n=1 Tax=Marinimicrobium agarilyticum TaxID=306546 RepID=UPI000409AB2A|nr:endo-1,4-beta-xylanase [Marinimicrobium agarilyticum]
MIKRIQCKCICAAAVFVSVHAAHAITAGAGEATLNVNNNWGTGYCASVTVANDGTTDITNWAVGLDLNGTTINNLWNGNLSGDSVTPVAYSANVAPGSSTNFGFCASGSGSPSIATFDVEGGGTSTSSSSEISSRSSSSSSSVSSATGGDNSVTVRMSGVTGEERVSLVVGGQTVETWTLSIGMLDYSVNTNVSGELRVAYTNNSGDRDVQVDYVIVNGVTYQAENQQDNTGAWDGECGAGSYSEMLHCNGSIGFGNPFDGSVSSSSSSRESSSSSEAAFSSSVNSNGYFSIEPDFQLSMLADFPVGVAVTAGKSEYSMFNIGDAAQRQEVIVDHFDQVSAGNIMKMSYLHPEENVYTYEDADQLANFAQTNGMTVHGHVLVWHSDYQVPDFMKGYDGDWKAMLTEHATNIITHFDEAFGDTVASWDVVNEAVDTGTSDGRRHSPFYDYEPPAAGEIPPYIEVAFQAAHNAKPELDLYYNDYDNTANQGRLNKTLQIAERLNEQGTIDGVGFQMHIYMNYPSLSHFENAFQAVVDMGLKVKVTELDISVVNPYGAGDPPPQPEYDAELAQAQKIRFCEVAKVYLDTVPAAQRGGFTVWGLTDDQSWLMRVFRSATGADYDDVWPLLFNADLSAKPALQGVANAFNGVSCSAG